MRTPREIEIQDTITKFLVSNELFPFSVVYTFCQSDGILGITFWIPSDISRFLEILDYRSQCDKSGYSIYEKENTIILTGIALLNLYVNYGERNV